MYGALPIPDFPGLRRAFSGGTESGGSSPQIGGEKNFSSSRGGEAAPAGRFFRRFTRGSAAAEKPSRRCFRVQRVGVAAADTEGAAKHGPAAQINRILRGEPFAADGAVGHGRRCGRLKQPSVVPKKTRQAAAPFPLSHPVRALRISDGPKARRFAPDGERILPLLRVEDRLLGQPICYHEVNNRTAVRSEPSVFGRVRRAPKLRAGAGPAKRSKARPDRPPETVLAMRKPVWYT